LGSARRTRQVVANAQGDRSVRTCARLWSRIQQSDSSRTTVSAEASATSGNHTDLCSRKTQLTSRSESPVASSPTWNGFLGDCGRSWTDRSGGRERPPSQNERVISRRNWYVDFSSQEGHLPGKIGRSEDARTRGRNPETGRQPRRFERLLRAPVSSPDRTALAPHFGALGSEQHP
jgi:hypothetical protein